MANPEHLAILKQGVEVWNRWKSRNADVRADFSEADLQKADLEAADLSWATLRDCLLTGANLRFAKLNAADLSDADVKSADLSVANLSGAKLPHSVLYKSDLSWSNLTGADLTDSDLREANLTGTNLTRVRLLHSKFGQATMGSTIFVGNDLSSITGLEAVKHIGPSGIGIDTIYLSKGKIPDQFLRSIGVPEPFIKEVHHLAGAVQPIQFYACFISYSTADQSFADHLHADLQAQGVRCWFALHDVRGGRKLHEQIDEAIRVYDRLLLILSEHSMSSEWVKTEVANARQREIREKRQMLFPISLVPYDRIKDWKAFDADTGKDSARKIREYFIPDFSNWKDHVSYQQAFQRLLRDLKAEGKESAPGS